ncbi:urease accessory protein UreF [Paraoerskovia sediminicola]|uniref:Urease accessory protein UreF n=1 Tax=Paraoerskovia sediminicola TaxID=1138587 RepID=A0ABM8G2U8_9CELL|nr:urease accessory UreF family protein [Paraoerskovia sediminicola]BDZ42367.1 urease accessory protein UreF [Paraoerskovia sediminicola]
MSPSPTGVPPRPAAAPPVPASPDLVLALLADSRLPVGGHTQSGGLEPAMAHAGLVADDVPAFVRGRLATVVAVEAGTAVVARHVTLTAPDRPGPSLDDVTAAWAARTPSRALRDVSRQLGRGFLRLARTLWPGDARLDALGRTPPRPVALGVVAALAGLDAARLVRLCGHDDVATVCAAVLKLDPLDPVRTTAWTLAAHADVERLVGRVAHLTGPDDIPSTSAPAVEHLSLLHHRTPRKLFHA